MIWYIFLNQKQEYEIGNRKIKRKIKTIKSYWFHYLVKPSLWQKHNCTSHLMGLFVPYHSVGLKLIFGFVYK